MRVLLLLAVVVAYAPTTRAADSAISCAVADVLAEKAYKRVENAMSKRQHLIAVEASRAFWDLEPYSSSCAQVSTRALDLIEAGFHKNMPDIALTGVSGYLKMDSGIGISRGVEPRPIYRVSPPVGGSYGEFRSLIGEDLQIGEFKKKYGLDQKITNGVWNVWTFNPGAVDTTKSALDAPAMIENSKKAVPRN